MAEKIKIGNRIANVLYCCTQCDCSSLTKEAFERHSCEDYVIRSRKLEEEEN